MKANARLLVDLIAAEVRDRKLATATEIAGVLGADEFTVYDELRRLAKLGRVARHATRVLPSLRHQMLHDKFSVTRKGLRCKTS